MPPSGDGPITVVLLSPAPVPGRVLTGLIGPLRPAEAAGIHSRLLACTMSRLARLLPATEGHRHILAIAGLEQALEHLKLPRTCGDWQWLDQGGGSLGQRLEGLWSAMPHAPVAFIQSGHVDLPAESLAQLPARLDTADLLLGPDGGGGLWLIGGPRCPRRWLRAIDWQDANVYHQAVGRARALGHCVATLPPCPAVMRYADLRALQRRLADADDADLLGLSRALARG